MKVFVINLTNEVKRRYFQEKQLTQLGLNYTITTAVSVDDINKTIYEKHYHDWQRPLRKAEMACYFSHQKLWQTIIDNNQPALILEDDAILSKDTAKVLQALENKIDIDLVDFEVFAKQKYLAKTGETLIDDYQLFYIHLNSAGAGAYVLYPSGAKKLLACEAKKGIAPTDSHIPDCHALKSLQIEPALSMQPEFLEYYCLENKYHEWTYSTTSADKTNKQKFVFKRIIAQIKLGLYKLWLLPIANKRFIKLNKQDFKK